MFAASVLGNGQNSTKEEADRNKAKWLTYSHFEWVIADWRVEAKNTRHLNPECIF